MHLPLGLDINKMELVHCKIFAQHIYLVEGVVLVWLAHLLIH